MQSEFRRFGHLCCRFDRVGMHPGIGSSDGWLVWSVRLVMLVGCMVTGDMLHGQCKRCEME